jgi:hypothetical protein
MGLEIGKKTTIHGIDMRGGLQIVLTYIDIKVPALSTMFLVIDQS